MRRRPRYVQAFAEPPRAYFCAAQGRWVHPEGTRQPVAVAPRRPSFAAVLARFVEVATDPREPDDVRARARRALALIVAADVAETPLHAPDAAPREAPAGTIA